MNQRANRYAQIDVLEFVFAILIVCLHISGNDQKSIVYLIGQYVGRMGVPFFFAVSGFFAYQKVKEGAPVKYLKRQEIKLLRIFLVWSLIYFPITFHTTYINNGGDLLFSMLEYVRELIFMAPAYMWYLVALMFGLFLFVLYGVSHLPQYTIGASLFYILGTLLNSYRTITGFDSFEFFYNFFLTSRNGIFFTPIFLAIGAWINVIHTKQQKIKKQSLTFIIACVVFFIEVTLVMRHVPQGEDCSMYFSLPLVIGVLLGIILNISVIKENQTTNFLKRASLIIYCSQYGLIIVYRKLIGDISEVILWIMVVISGCILAYSIQKLKKELRKLTIKQKGK